MDKKGRTSMVNNTLRQESGAVPRRIAIDSIRHMGSDSGKVLPNAGKRPNVAPITVLAGVAATAARRTRNCPACGLPACGQAFAVALPNARIQANAIAQEIVRKGR
ncbi:hypothetical protein [Mesorhizobium delmotii]